MNGLITYSLSALRVFVLMCIVLGENAHAAPDMPIPASQSPQQLAFIKELVEQHQFDSDYISQTLSSATIDERVLKAIASPWEAKPWYQYYPIFLTERRITEGVAFWRQYEKVLTRAENEIGVDAEVIVAILGVETNYGNRLGRYPVLDALYSLGFHYPPRASFFRKELKEFFLLTREEGFDPLTLKGSYAGAMGWGQFISSSYRHYAIDFDGDGVRDLFNNPVDAIGSVANYFKVHGWRKRQPVAYRATLSQQDVSHLVSRGLKMTHTLRDLQESGISLQSSSTIDAASKAKLLELEIEEGKEYWVGLPNFYTITRYNHSALYAMAVFQLSQEIAKSYHLVKSE